jgi:hypothetical protein
MGVGTLDRNQGTARWTDAGRHGLVWSLLELASKNDASQPSFAHPIQAFALVKSLVAAALVVAGRSPLSHHYSTVPLLLLIHGHPHPIRLLLPSRFVYVGNAMSVWLPGCLPACLLSSSICLNHRTLSAMPVMSPVPLPYHACISDTLPVGHWADSSLSASSLPGLPDPG